MLGDEHLSKVVKDLWQAVVNATTILNRSHERSDVNKAHDHLRQGLVDFADAAPSDHVVPWMPYLSDRADGVKGRFAIARWNPSGAGCREVWNLPNDEWAAFSDEVLTYDEAIALIKTMAFAPTEHSKKKRKR